MATNCRIGAPKLVLNKGGQTLKSLKREADLPVGTLEATLERKRMTTASTAVPAALSMRAYGSMKSHKALGMPVLLKPSTVMNIPQKNISKE